MNNELKGYELKRYYELKEIIDNKDFDQISEYIDYNIIKKTDLLERFKQCILNIETYEEKIQHAYQICLEIMENIDEELLNKFVILEIDEGNYNEDIISFASNKEEIYNYFLKKIKEPKYEINCITNNLKEDEKFINYCLDNKKLSVFNAIGKIDDKYYDRVKQLIDEGYGFCYTEYRAENEKVEALFPKLAENGYIGACTKSCYEKNNKLEQFINTIKNLIDNNKPIYINKYIQIGLYNDQANDILNQILKQKKYQYLELLTNERYSYTDENVRLLIEALKTNPNISKYINHADKRFYNDEVISILDRNNDIYSLKKIILNINKLDNKDNNKYIEIIKRKLLEGNKIIMNYSIYDFIFKYKDYDLIDKFVSNDLNNMFFIFDIINNDNERVSLYDKKLYDTLKKHLNTIYDLNINHLDKFVEKFGYNYLYYIKNENIRNSINLDDENFNKYLNLFNTNNLNLTDIQNIYDSILQHRFKKENISDIDRLSRIKLALTSKEKHIPLDDLKVLANNIDINKIKQLDILNDNEINELNNSPLDFLIRLCNEIINKQNIEKNINIIYNINRLHIKNKREEYRELHNYLDEVNLNYKYDEKSLLDATILDYYKNYDPYMIKQEIKLNNELVEGIENSYVIYGVIRYLLKDNEKLAILYKDFPNLTEDKLRKLIGKVKIILSDNNDIKRLMQQEYYVEKIASNNNIKKTYYPIYDSFKIFKILSEINPYELKDTVFNNVEKEKELKKLLDKYKFIYWQDTFNKALENSNIECDDSTIAAFISKYNEMHEYIAKKKENKEDINLVEILKYASVLSSNSNRYSLLFGKEDYMFLKLNPNPNSSPIIRNNEERLEIAVDNLIKLYEKKEITTPPIDKKIEINGKKININLGNFTNPINLTYGERTGSCMRINGAGKTLYSFCQTNPNAFHIRLTDENNKFISRVSGYRNGNSIFLNELRHSENNNYNDNDVINTIKEVANMIIESTKNSSCPIENVFITNQYAMENNNNLVTIKENIKEGLPNFYFDLNNEAIVLQTTAKEGNYVPINTNKANVPTYLVLRDKVKELTNNKEILESINSYRLLKEIITNNKEYKTTSIISPEQSKNILYMIKGEDFIVYLNSNLEIKKDYIPRNDNRVKIELENSINKIKQIKEEIENERRNGHSRQI